MNRDSVNVCGRKEWGNNYRTDPSKARGLKGEWDGKAGLENPPGAGVLNKGVSKMVPVWGFLARLMHKFQIKLRIS